MIQAENILLHIKHLLQHGQMPSSACGASLRRALRPLLDSGVVVEEKAGGGRRLVVRNVTTFRDFSRSHFPDVPTDSDLGTRTAGVARFRDSKSFLSDTPEVISVRAWAGNALLKSGNPLPAISATLEHGVFSFLLTCACGIGLRLCVLRMPETTKCMPPFALRFPVLVSFVFQAHVTSVFSWGFLGSSKQWSMCLRIQKLSHQKMSMTSAT